MTVGLTVIEGGPPVQTDAELRALLATALRIGDRLDTRLIKLRVCVQHVITMLPSDSEARRMLERGLME